MRHAVLGLLASVLAIGCVYPHRSTSISAVANPRTAATMDAPPDVWQLTVVEAHVRPRRRGDLTWDDNGGEPDVYVRLIRNEEVVWESETIDDSLNPQWNVTLPRNFRTAVHDSLRIEVWDRDTVGSDPVGIYRGRGLPPTAVPGADARILLEGGSYLTIRISPPRAHRGVGIDEYELRPDVIEILSVAPYSPAGRAELQPGDLIVAIGDQRVSALSDAQAASALSMVLTRSHTLTIRRGSSPERTVELDQGYVWLTM
ncbi:MAG: PDZ domain-containing protein [Sandaracinaceae bacterium]